MPYIPLSKITKLNAKLGLLEYADGVPFQGDYIKTNDGKYYSGHSNTDLSGYGRFYPEWGAIVLSGNKLSSSLGGPTGSAGLASGLFKFVEGKYENLKGRL